MYQINNEKAVKNVDFRPLLAILVSTSRDVIIVYVTDNMWRQSVVDGKTQSLQGHVT